MSRTPNTVTRHESSPPFPKVAGVTISVAPQADPGNPLLVHGSFNVPYAQAEALGRPIHRAIVLVVQIGEYHNVLMPFREFVLFADDEFGAPSNGIGGYFNLDVFSLLGAPIPGDYHLVVSIGEYVSTAAEASVTP